METVRPIRFRQLFTGMALITLAAGAGPADGGEEMVITVTTVEDVSDASGGVEGLPGPDGRVSFREAVAVVNSTPGPQTIAFAIPQDDWWLFTDVALLKLENGGFALIDDGTTLDFTTQTDFTGDTNPNGPEVGIYGLQPNGWGIAAIFIYGDNCTINGLGTVQQRGYGLDISGNNNRVIGCTITGAIHSGVRVNGQFGAPPAANNIIGGTAPGEGNTLSGGSSGVRVDGPTDGTIVIGNYLTGGYAGIEVRGAPCCPGNEAMNTRIGGPTPEERNVIVNAGYFGEHGSTVGAQVSIEHTPDTLVEGNWIGFEADGITPGSNRGAIGVRIHSATNTTVRNNVISGIAVNAGQFGDQRSGIGIHVSSESDNTLLTGNIIGMDPTGQFPLPNVFGVYVSPFSSLELPTNLTIGGIKPGAGNTIAFNESTGVVVRSLIEGVAIVGNSMHNNGDLGIDLLPASGEYGVNTNDALDADDAFDGGNRIQNYPIVQTAERSGDSILITGSLESAPGETFFIDFYISSSCDPSGFGEGERYLGRTTVITDAAGRADFSPSLIDGASGGNAITATAMDSASNTSEFSACVLVTTPPFGDVTANGTITFDDIIAVINAFGACPLDAPCPADLNHSGDVNIDDLFAVLNAMTPQT